jgi:dTDP-4-amino-4,6-dideoxygalactose transaminase
LGSVSYQPLPCRESELQATSAAIEAVALNVRVNAVAVAPGPIQIEMLDRITASETDMAAMLATVPLKRAETPDKNCGCNHVCCVK